jgi:hypothetical protein
MTEEQILQLAGQHFDYQGGWIADKEQLLKFAQAMYDEGYVQCSFDMGDENV